MAYPFYEKSKELGLKVVSVHKGFASQSRTLGHYAHPGDIEKAALDQGGQRDNAAYGWVRDNA